MNSLAHKIRNRILRAHRVRSSIIGSSDRPRLSVHVSNSHITAQIVNDTEQRTLAYASTVGTQTNGTMIDKAAWVGQEIAKKAKTAKIKRVVFDRGGKLYHGRIKAWDDTART